MMRWDIINRLVETYGYQTYLEIGVYNKALNYHKVKCQKKLGVDPDPKAGADIVKPSDAFFAKNRQHFDLIFIDGLHHADQVERDISNALKFLTDNGSIVVHDCNPTTEAMQQVPRIQGEWTGDVWRAWVKFRSRPDLSMSVLDTDYGVGIIRKGWQKPIQVPESATYQDFNKNRKEWLNLIPVELDPISICIPAFEQYGFGDVTLKECLESIKMQTIKAEIIVSDNSTTLQALAEKYGAKYYHNPERGGSANTNFAISKATNPLIKVMYQDDKLIDPRALETFAWALKFDQWVASDGFAIDAQSVQKRRTRPQYSETIIKGKNTIGMPSVTGWRQNDLKFDTNLKTLLDCEFYYQMHQQYGQPGYIRKPLIGSRYWPGSTSHKQGNLTQQELPYVLKKHGLIK